MSPFPLKDTTLLYTSQEGRMSQHSKISQQAESRATPLVCSSEACSLRSDSLAALINPDAGMTRETKCAGGNVQGEGKQDASICAQQMRGALALFPGSSRPRHSASACTRLSGRTPKFSRKEKKEREKKSRLETKKKRKRSFLQFPAAALRQLLLRQQSCKHSLEEEAPPLLLRALPDSPPSSGVHGASGSCCCADMILSKMRRCHGARGRARDVAGWREGWGGGHAHDPGTECSLPRAELELTHHRRHAPLYDSTDGPVI